MPMLHMYHVTELVSFQRQASKFHDNTKEAISHTMEVYVQFVANRAVATFTILVYFLYLAFSIYVSVIS